MLGVAHFVQWHNMCNHLALGHFAVADSPEAEKSGAMVLDGKVALGGILIGFRILRRKRGFRRFWPSFMPSLFTIPSHARQCDVGDILYFLIFLYWLRNPHGFRKDILKKTPSQPSLTPRIPWSHPGFSLHGLAAHFCW